jgi:hypothetical protein
MIITTQKISDNWYKAYGGDFKGRLIYGFGRTAPEAFMNALNEYATYA